MANRWTHRRRSAARKERQASAYAKFVETLRMSQNAEVKIPLFEHMTQRGKHALMRLYGGTRR